MQKRLIWQAYTNDDRHKIIEAVKQGISVNDGSIMNFNMFSDLALSLSIEIDENRMLDLHRTLSGILEISDFNAESIEPKSTKEWLVFINISFGGGKGQLRTEKPAVPG